jgi:16S rRNA (uracil1498-N3)-methyltransferase
MEVSGICFFVGRVTKTKTIAVHRCAVGSWCECIWTNKTGSGSLEICSDVHFVPKPPPLAIAFAPVKGGGGGHDWLAQKLTEIGVSDIYPLLPTKRSLSNWTRKSGSNSPGSSGEGAGINMARIFKICRQASMQSRRVYLPHVHQPSDIRRIAAIDGAAIADPSGSSLNASHSLLIIGPEGGWDADELELFDQRVSLGDHVLRSETAGVVAAALMAAMLHARLSI